MAVQIPSALAKAVKDRQAVLFAGAGISYNTLKVGGLELRNWVGAEIKKDFPDYDYTNRSLEDVCDEYAVLNDRTSLVVLLSGLIPQNVPAPRSHVAVVNTFRFVITTNWDQLFEDAARQAGERYQILMDEADAPMFSYDQHNLLKIHGSIDRPQSLVCTTEDYEGYADTRPNLLKHVEDLIYNNTVLFVGYGMRDEHLRRLFSQIRRRRAALTRRHYVVGFYDAVRERLLQSRQMQVIQEDAEEFLTELQKVV